MLPFRTLALALLAFLALSLGPSVVAGPAPPRKLLPDGGWRRSPALSWPEVNDWYDQLQNLDLVALGRTRFDLVVIDYSCDGTANCEFSPAQIAALKNSPGGPKLVLAYLSIGEAENYRYYWDPNWVPGDPEWLDEENPDWPGNFRVRYWYPEWQRIIFGTPTSYLDKIIAQGFDGVYLDKIDTYEDYQEQRPSAPQDMVSFVLAIAGYARQRTGNPSFGIFPQNGEGLAVYPSYVAGVTGIGREHPYYGYPGEGDRTPPEVTSAIELNLDRFRAAGKLVLTLDYPYADPRALGPSLFSMARQKLNLAYSRARSRGYIPTATVVALDRILIHPGHQPD